MYFKLLNFICFSFFNFYCLASILFKGFVAVPIYFVFLIFNFFNFYILNVFFFVFIFQIYIYLGFFMVFFFGIYVFIVGFKRFMFSFGFENNIYISEYSENFFSANFFCESLFIPFYADAQFENRVYFFNFFFKALKKLTKFPCRKDRNSFVYIIDKPNMFFDQFNKITQAKKGNFLSRFYLQERFDYIRTPEETRYELLERYQGRFLPPYTDVQYRRVFRDSYREYLDKFYRPKINYYNKFSFNQVSSLGPDSRFDSTFMVNFFLPREFCNFVFLQIEKYFLSEFSVFLNFFVFESKFFVLFFSTFFFGGIYNKVFLGYFLVLVYVTLFLFFLGKYYFQSSKFLYIFVYSFFRIRLLVLGFFSVFNFFYHAVYFFRVLGSFFFFQNIFNGFEFFRFKKFSRGFSEYFNFKTLHLFKSLSYTTGSRVYSQDFPFSLSVYNPLRSTYPGFESWDCVDYMLNPAEFNLYYSNQPFNFQHLPAVSMYRPRSGISKLKNKFNHFFVNEFSFPFTYFEENFSKVGSFVNTYVFFFVFFVTFIPFLCIEIIRFLLIQIIFFLVHFFNNTVRFFYNRVNIRFSFIFSLFSKIFYQTFKICLFLFLAVKLFVVLPRKVEFRFIDFRKIFGLDNSKVNIFNFFKRSINWVTIYVYFFLNFLWLNFYTLRNKFSFLLFICLLAFLSVKLYFKLTIVQLYVIFYFCWQTFFKVFFAEIFNKLFDGSFVKYIGINFYPSVIFFVIISSTLFWCYIFKSTRFFKKVIYFNLFSYSYNPLLIFFRKFIQFMFGKASLKRYRMLLFWQPVFSFEHKHYNDEYDEEDDYEEEDDEHWDPDEDSELVYSEETLTSDEFILDYGFDLDEELFVLGFDGVIPYMDNLVTRPPLWGRFKFPPLNFFPFKQLNYYFPYRMKLGEYEALYINNVDIHDIQPRKDGKDALIDEHDFPFSLEFVPMFKLFNSAMRLGKFPSGIPKFSLPAFNFSGYYKFREFDSVFYNFFSSVDTVYTLPYLRPFFNFRFLTLEFQKRFLSSSFLISYSFMPILTCSDVLTKFLISQTPVKFFPDLAPSVNDTISFSKKLYLNYFNFFNFSIRESEFVIFTAKYFFNYVIDLYKYRFNTVFEIMLFNQGNVYSNIRPNKQLFFSSISDPVIDLSFSTSHAIVIFYLLIAEEPFSENAGLIPRRFIYNLSMPFENGTFNMIKIRRLYRFYDEEEENDDDDEEEEYEEYEEEEEEDDDETKFNEHLYIDSNLSSMILTHPQDIPPVSQWPWKEIFWVFFEFIKEQLD